jgi:hypothetical protein
MRCNDSSPCTFWLPIAGTSERDSAPSPTPPHDSIGYLRGLAQYFRMPRSRVRPQCFCSGKPRERPKTVSGRIASFSDTTLPTRKRAIAFNEETRIRRNGHLVSEHFRHGRLLNKMRKELQVTLLRIQIPLEGTGWNAPFSLSMTKNAAALR